MSVVFASFHLTWLDTRTNPSGVHVYSSTLQVRYSPKNSGRFVVVKLYAISANTLKLRLSRQFLILTHEHLRYTTDSNVLWEGTAIITRTSRAASAV